jgi:hypothetical protein
MEGRHLKISSHPRVRQIQQRASDAACLPHNVPMPRSNDWTRDQLLIALRLYIRLPFGRLHGKNPEIVHVARAIGRTSGALAMKACNFASLDLAWCAVVEILAVSAPAG